MGPPREGAHPTYRFEVAAGAAGVGDSHPRGEGAELSRTSGLWGRAVSPVQGHGGAGPLDLSAPGSPGCKALHPALGGAQGGERTLPAEAGTRLRSPLPARACSHCLQ